MSDWTDWTQNRRIADAEEALDAERRARSRLSEQMRQQQGNLQGQLDRLTRAMVALIEHEDIRAELGQHADAATCRRYAREVVATVVVTGGAALRETAEPGDVPGYWLAAAARGVAAIARGEVSGEALLEAATQRDPARTALFLTLLAALTRDPAWARAPFERVVPDQDRVSGAQRQVWLAVTDGRLPAGEPALAAALGQRLSAAGDATAAGIDDWLRAQVPSGTGGLPQEKALVQLQALQRLLRGETLPGDDPADQPTPAGAAEATEDPLADCLRSLVDEGSPAEGDILDRMARARADLGFLDERVSARSAAWSSPAGDVLDLLLADLAAPADSGRHRLARRVLAPHLDAAAERRVAEAAATVAPTRAVTVAGQTIDVRAGGAVRDWRAGVQDAAARRTPRTPYLLQGGAAALAVGVVALGLAFVAGGFAVLGVVALLGGAAAVVTALLQARGQREAQEATVGSAERQVDQLAATIADETSRATAAASTAQAVRAEIGNALA